MHIPFLNRKDNPEAKSKHEWRGAGHEWGMYGDEANISSAPQ